MGRSRRKLPKVFLIRADFPTRLIQTPDAIKAFSTGGVVLNWNCAIEIKLGFSQVGEERRILKHALTKRQLAGAAAISNGIRRSKP